MFARGGPGWQLYGAVGETPTGVGRCLRGPDCEGRGFCLEKPPPRWGGVCDGPVGDIAISHQEKPPPRWGGVCDALGANQGARWLGEKPPPKWGGLCESAIGLMRRHRGHRRNPHRSGCALRDFGQHCVNVNRKTPTEVGPPSLTTNFQCPAPSIAQRWPVGAGKANPRRGPGVAGRLG